MTKQDAIQSKLGGIESWIYKAKNLHENEIIELGRVLQIVRRFVDEAIILVGMDEKEGQSKGWWD